MACTGEAQCPIRIGDPCSLCHPGASAPENCGLVYLVMTDPDLREELLQRWSRWKEEQARQERPATAGTVTDLPHDGIRPGR